MSKPHCNWRRAIAAEVVCVTFLGGASLAAAQPTAQKPAREIFTAFASNVGTADGSQGASRSEIIHVIIERWSTDQERQALVKAFEQKGADGLLAALQKMESLGTLRASSTLGWDLRYAVQVPMADGGRRIIVGTDRRVNYWQASGDKRAGYPFTLVELRLDKEDRGEGRMSIATKIGRSKDGTRIELEHFSSDPVRLQDVHKEKD